MGRRKIEIKAIKDDRNRSVTFLKRKGGLFKKAHELSVLCSVDVAVFIFGSNKKLYEYSSGDMRELITRYQYFGGPNEHKGPGDFNGGANDDDDDDDENGTPPHGEGMDPSMLPPHFQGQPPPFPHLRGHTPSASPPIGNGVPFQQQHPGQHPGHPGRSHTPQPQMGSRPGSRNDIRRMNNMAPQPVGAPPGPQPAVNGYAYMPQPAIYNPQNPPNMPPNMPHGLPPQHGAPQYPYPPPQSQQPQGQPMPQPMPQYMEEQRRSLPPSYPPQGPQQPPVSRAEPSPQPAPQQLPPQQQPPIPQTHISPPPPQPQQIQVTQPQEAHPPAAMEPKPEPLAPGRPKAPLLNTDMAIKKLPQRKQHSIFTPIDEGRSILSQHLAFHEPKDSDRSKSDPSRSQSIDVGSVSRTNGITTSPPVPQRANTQSLVKPRIPETTFTPPSRSNSLKVGGGGPVSARPRLKVQIPDGGSENGSATADSHSPRNVEQPMNQTNRPVLPPPSPSASALLSAGASGPPNPFARPISNQNNNSMSIDTPVSALPSRFLNNEFLPSPSSFYPSEWDFRGHNNNTLPSPLNFATPVVGTGPSFLRDEAGPTVGAGAGAKRKTPEAPPTSNAQTDAGSDPSPDAKRAKHE